MKNLEVILPQGKIRDVKNYNKSATLNFFRPLLELFENWLLVTCIAKF